jgi:uncharacterized protein (TIGR04222 family)
MNTIIAVGSGPWGLSGPEFLVGYVATLTVCVIVAYSARRRAVLEISPLTALPRLDNVYQMAYLAADRRRVVQCAIAALATSERIRPQRSHRIEAVDGSEIAGIEAAVYRVIESRPGARYRDVCTALREDQQIGEIGSRLEQDGLRTTRSQRYAARRPVWLFVALGLIGVIRAVNGEHRHRPIGLLVLLLVVTAAIALYVACNPPRRTARGDAVLRSLRESHAAGLGPPSGVRYDNPAHGDALMAATAVALLGPVAIEDKDLRTALFGASASGGDGGGGGCGGGGCGGGCGG